MVDPRKASFCRRRLEEALKKRREQLLFAVLFSQGFGCFLEGFQFRSEVFFVIFGHPINEEDALQVIGFMLHGAAQQAAAAELPRGQGFFLLALRRAEAERSESQAGNVNSNEGATDRVPRS